MSLAHRTKVYATEVAETALNSFEKQARGTLQAPDSNENVRMFTARGGSAITLGSTTASATVVFDPESSLRNGQMNVVLYGRDAAGATTEVKSVNLGRPTEEFLAAGVLSSGLKVFNSSGVDVIGGTQTAAVLSSIPQDVSTLTATQLANASSNHERDLVSGVVSRDDATMTMAMTEHFGTKMALCRPNTMANVVQRSWDDGIDSRRTTDGQSLGFLVDTNMNVTTSIPTLATVLSTANFRAFDTDRLSASNNPLTLATYTVSVDAYIEIASASATSTDLRIDVTIYALDADNNLLASKDIRDALATVSGSNYDIRAAGTITSSTVPIARVIVAPVKYSADLTNDTFNVATSTCTVTAFEETADIPARNIHVCVLEGLNASATINLSSSAVITGVPDSTNVFISAGSAGTEVFDQNAVKVFLSSIYRVLPRAFTVGGHGVITKSLTAMYGDSEVEIAFKAMSFGSIVDKVAQVASAAKAGGKEAAELMSKMAPILSLMPGTVGAMGRGAAMGAEALRSL